MCVIKRTVRRPSKTPFFQNEKLSFALLHVQTVKPVLTAGRPWQPGLAAAETVHNNCYDYDNRQVMTIMS